MIHKIEYSYKFKPNFSDMDSYCYAHHSKYLIWFENARIYYIEEFLKLNADAINSLRFPVMNLSVKYYEPIVFGEEYLMQVKIEFDDNMPILNFSYRILNEFGKKLYTKAQTSHVLVNEKNEMTDYFPKELLDKFLLQNTGDI